MRVKTETVSLSLFLFFMTLMLTLSAAWFTHVIITIKTASYLLLIAGAIFFPIGIVHGIGYWFGAF
jgi:hypothetical protein